jgi:2'-5' RNA ligase
MSNAPRLSVQILLPEALDRRFARWAKQMPGASWPAWGGHITLVPYFTPACPETMVFDRVVAAVRGFHPFRVRLTEPVAVQDWTRPQYQAVFLAAHEAERDDHQTLAELQQAIAAALAPVRHDVKPALDGQPFVPHLTLALGLGSSEAEKLVRAIRADPLEADFVVDAVWLMVMWQSDGPEPRVDRVAIPLETPVKTPAKPGPAPAN